MIRPVRRAGERTLGVSLPIVRPRVLGEIASAASRPIVLLIAPAGYGKSVALRQYLATLANPCVRYDVGPEHVTLLGFLRGLCDALDGVAPHLRATLAGAYERNPPSPVRGADLALWMHAHLEGYRGVIAIDDLHVAQGDPDVVRFLVALIESSKEHIRWVIASRSRAGLPIATWAAYEASHLEMNEHDLRFTEEEARDAAHAFHLGIADDELDELLELTGGWALGLSFALRNAMRSADLRTVSSSTREMIYRYLAEQVYKDLEDEERELLEVAAVMPAIDVTILERAGFDRALAIVERLCEETAFISKERTEGSGTYRSHDLFREFLRYQIALRGQRAQEAIYERAARALEAAEEIEHALDTYVKAASQASILRLLEQHGLALLERAGADVVARALNALDPRTHRDHPQMLVLRASLYALEGKNGRAESLLRKAIATAGPHFEAGAQLRLGTLLINSGKDAYPLLSALVSDGSHTNETCAEAYSLMALQKRIDSDDHMGTKSAIDRAQELLLNIDDISVRTKVLQRLGIALGNAGDRKRAIALLEESTELASELNLYGFVSRGYLILSILVMQEHDDIKIILEYARRASAAAVQAGDAFSMQSALLQVLSAELRSGNDAEAEKIEKRLETLYGSRGGFMLYLVPTKALRLSWIGRFKDAHLTLNPHWRGFHHDVDKVSMGATCALFLGADGCRDESIRTIRDVLTMMVDIDFSGVYRARARAISLMLCVLAEVFNGRRTSARNMQSRIERSGDPIITLACQVTNAVLSFDALHFERNAQLTDLAAGFRRHGYAHLTSTLRVISAALPGPIDRANDNALTAAELEVLRFLADGISPKAIAQQSRRSVFTVRSHIARAVRKLGCQGYAEAVVHARRRGLLS